jgi:outer membrane protein
MHRLARILLISLAAAAPLWAQEKGQRVFSLDDCLRIASQQNLDIRNSESQMRSASAEVTGAFGAYLPNIDISGGYQRRLNVDGGQAINIGGQVISTPGAPANSYSLSAAANLTVFDGFAREAQYERAQNNLSATDYSIRHTRQDVYRNVRTQFLEVLRTEEVAKVRRQDLELAKAELGRFRAQYDVGRISIAPVLTQEAEIGNRELALIQSENDVAQAKATLLASIGMDPSLEAVFTQGSIPSEISDRDREIFRNSVGSLPTAVGTALKNRNDVISAEYQVKSSEESVRGARSGYMPQISAGGGWSWSNSELNNFSELGRSYIGLNFRVPVFDRFQTNTQVQSATVQYEQQSIRLEQAKQRVSSEVQQAILRLSAAEKQLDISTRLLASAEQNFQSAKERFDIGAATILDYTTANNQLIVAKINRVSFVYQYIAAQYTVQYALGLLDKI